MNVRLLVTTVCVIGAMVALAWPSGAVRVAAVMFGAIAGAMLLDNLVRTLDGIGPLRPVRTASEMPRFEPVVAPELGEIKRELAWSQREQPMPDVVYVRLQQMARQRVRRSLGLDPALVGNHAALARAIPAQLFTLVMSGYVADPRRSPTEAVNVDAPLVRGYVPYHLRPPMSALAQLMEEIEAL